MPREKAFLPILAIVYNESKRCLNIFSLHFKMPQLKSGFISILGRPNVGKSTLLNQIVQQKISIVTNKPQTTRNRIHAIKTVKDVQMVFIDTPGIFEGKLELCRYMRGQALKSMKGVDLVLFVTDRAGPLCDDDRYILSRIKQYDRPAFFILNKVDKMEKEDILLTLSLFSKEFLFRELFPLSALEKDSTALLEKEIISSLPEGPFYFPEDAITDQTEEFLISELIREKIFKLTQKEVPYASAVGVEKMEDRKSGMLVIYAAIYVEKESQKGILIGRGGRLLKKIGTQARMDMEKRLGTKVFLDLQIKVKKEWSRTPRSLKELGYE